jgi:hypothetical protein
VWPSLGSSPRTGYRVAGQRLDVGDELAAPRAGERGGDRHLEAELKEWPAETLAMKGVRQKQESESVCLEVLKELMTAKPNEPIVVKEELRQQFSDVSQRRFESLYSQAARETHSAPTRPCGGGRIGGSLDRSRRVRGAKAIGLRSDRGRKDWAV